MVYLKYSVFYIVLVNCFGILSLWAQPKTLLVKINPSFKSIIEQKIPPGCVFSTVDKAFGLYRCAIPKEWHPGQFARQINAIEGVLATQFSKNLVRRVQPNDPFYGQQQFLSTIKAPVFWDKNTGGINKRGDTLVVAIIDDGMDTSHPDLIANMWINRNEIPWNGVDDDGNGYVDDYRGWNGGDTNPKTFTTQSLFAHGTEISGIVGASGNNGKGIAGINWNVKIMPLVCYPLNGVDGDLGVIRSMLYVLRMKQLFLHSGGSKGACIMSVNTSVGIDGAFPQEEPIWCSLYDSLGMAGIISSIATTNSNVNVGRVGDIPSLCPSRYTLVVNNTDANDNRVSSGYNDTFVDLAAPGQGVFTTQLSTYNNGNGPYAGVSGSSFAAPQVAAAIALLSAGVCDTFWTLHQNKPDSAASLLKGWIVEGVDKLTVLKGKCATSGRLNIQRARDAMNTWCTSLNQNLATKPLIYPNPVQPGSAIYWAGQLPKLQWLSLMSMDGKVVVKQLNTAQSKITLPTLPPGMYWLSYANAGRVEQLRLLIAETVK